MNILIFYTHPPTHILYYSITIIHNIYIHIFKSLTFRDGRISSLFDIENSPSDFSCTTINIHRKIQIKYVHGSFLPEKRKIAFTKPLMLHLTPVELIFRIQLSVWKFSNVNALNINLIWLSILSARSRKMRSN